jgi:CubicO group peptidase (beta-lactamase class C family)
VTSTDNPLEVDSGTLFQIGSTTKTFTATALMRLVEQGRVDLDATVRRYLPDFRVGDETASATVTVRHLTNHTAGWAGDYLGRSEDHGAGALRRYVEDMAELPQEFPVGSATSYNNAAFNLLGRIIEVVTEQPYEQAMRELLLTPLGLERTFLLPTEVMTYRYAVGHHQDAAGGFGVARPWSIPRGSGPAGAIAATVGDQLRWLAFHLGDGTAADGTRLLEADTLRGMQEPAAPMPAGNASADHVGVAWMLKDVGGGVRKVAHGGSTIGQVSSFEMVPARRVGVTVLSNAETELSRVVARTVLAEYAGVSWADPQPTPRPTEQLREYAGAYAGSGYTVEISAVDQGLLLRNIMRPEVLEQLGITTPPPEPPPMSAAMVGETGDVFVLTGGAATGATGGFHRDPRGRIVSMNLGGRMAFPIREEQ